MASTGPLSARRCTTARQSHGRVLAVPKLRAAALPKQLPQTRFLPLRLDQASYLRQHKQQLYAVNAAASDAAAAGGGAGDAEPSVPSVDEDFDLLSAEIKKLQEALADELKGCSIYLIGMMGTGKSTTGKMLANTLRQVVTCCLQPQGALHVLAAGH